jgi:GDPmannose 4,6-dehydratase
MSTVRCSTEANLPPVDISHAGEVTDLIRRMKPDEVYYLAAFHHSSEDKQVENIELFSRSHDVHVVSLINFLEAIMRHSSKTRLFYASSSHIFGNPPTAIQDENTPINPTCIYGITKADGLFTCHFYRNNHDIFTSVGILYNHESSLRHERFVSRKIIKGAIDIKKGKLKKLILGDLNAEIDWGYAPDFVDAMYRMLNHHEPDDFVVATGVTHTVKEFTRLAFNFLGLDYRSYVEVDPAIVIKKPYNRKGNPRKLIELTGWKPSVDFNQMIRFMIEDEDQLNV